MHAGGEYELGRRIGRGVEGRFSWLSRFASSCGVVTEGEGWASGVLGRRVTKEVWMDGGAGEGEGD